MDFHVSRRARDRFQFDESLFTLSGNVILANFHAARVVAQKINQRRDLARFPEQAVKASQINAMGLIHEITHYVFRSYRQQKNPNLLQDLHAGLIERFGAEDVERLLHSFCDEFPPVPVYRRELDIPTFLEGSTDGMPHRHMVLEEVLMLWLSNSNPAFAPFSELFDDQALRRTTIYAQAMGEVYEFFKSQPTFGPRGMHLIDLLLLPARMSPHSLEGQLEFIRTLWGVDLGRYAYRLLTSLDLIKEENKPIFFGGQPFVPVPVYQRSARAGDPEYEAYTADREWMPRLVLLAKNAYVWLDQLSKQYGRAIRTLDQIPDEELDVLARRGFTGLWLIGLWERSTASQRIKQMMGNPEAVASAYSLYDYQIARALGGEAAASNLRARAWQRGIRLSSDMVPNHVGIDGRWVMQHPDWFVSLPYSPYPVYSFNGPDLSSDPRVGIYLEDHYYTRSDAAVVFKRVDRWTGDERYIYHGNDGTNMPWNDTAQLNYLKPEVREAVIQTILHVARQFPIIRFDAAMTLAKRHYQRLWFPEPGSGGDIPSRSEYGLTRADFDRLMPQEFWREVVDRCAVEAPDTLLLAEAFWLMEGYFVRTLGMHRVYNSAFMHMLRDEDNAKYRQLIKNTIEFDPEILRRYVNFMNNPDEKTAVEQFGKGDKYFGICTVMVTVPGLPMFGHGQVEGFHEKYGMEYQRAYWDEHPDGHLIERHEREIFPLLQLRYLFAGVDQFRLYDFFTLEGGVNEDVLAYSNRYGDERALVVYHNRFASARGWIRTSAAYLVKGPPPRLVQSTLGEGLGLDASDGMYTIFRDATAGLEYIRNSRELAEQGMYIELNAYKCHVFLEFRQVQDSAEHRYGELAAYLGGRGVPSIEDARKEIFLKPVHEPLRQLFAGDLLRQVLAARVTSPAEHPDSTLLDEIDAAVLSLLQEIKQLTGGTGDEAALVADLRTRLVAILRLPATVQGGNGDGEAPAEALAHLASGPLSEDTTTVTLLGWLFLHRLGWLTGDPPEQAIDESRSWIDEWLLGRVVERCLHAAGITPQGAAEAIVLIKQLTCWQGWHLASSRGHAAMLDGLLADREVQQLVGVNRYQGVLWFNKEAFARLLWWLLLMAAVEIGADAEHTTAEAQATLAAAYRTVAHLLAAADESGYQVEQLRVAAAR